MGGIECKAVDFREAIRLFTGGKVYEKRRKRGGGGGKKKKSVDKTRANETRGCSGGGVGDTNTSERMAVSEEQREKNLTQGEEGAASCA